MRVHQKQGERLAKLLALKRKIGSWGTKMFSLRFDECLADSGPFQCGF